MAASGRFAGLEAETPYPGVRRRTVQAERMTVSEYTFEPGASFPLHRHAQEQVTLVEAGEVRLTAGGTTAVLGAGAWSVMPGGVEHGITAGPEGARIVAIISPRREGGGEITLAGAEAQEGPGAHRG
jgi:quercetin dioxygenase-like cupin family protein